MLTKRHLLARALLALAVAIGLMPLVLPAHAAPTTAASCVSQGNVWVHVEWDGSSRGGCATAFSTGLEALTSAGFTVDQQDGFVNAIDGIPTPKGPQDWWSYWHKVPTSSGSYPAAWEFSTLGAGSYRPVPGTVEGWRLWHSYSVTAEPPTVDPVAGVSVGIVPTVTSQPASVAVEAGSAASFTVAVAGVPAPTLAWYTSTGSGWTQVAGQTNTTLTLTGTTTAQSGLKVKARATNVAGSVDSDEAVLTVRDASSSVTIPDAGLRACVAKAAGVPADQLTQGKVATITELTCVNTSPAKISDLTGIGQLAGLSKLNLNTNAITDLTPVSGMTKLTKLWLSGNQLTTIDPLAGLTELSDVMVSRNKLTSIAAFAKLDKLTDVSIDYNTIADLTPLAKKADLTRLVANRNQIVSLAPLAGNTRLETLTAMQNRIVDVAPLAGLTRLKTLSLANNAIVNVAPLASLAKIERLDVGSNAILDVSPLGGLNSFAMLGFKARGQRVELPATAPGKPFALPTIKDRAGKAPAWLRPDGANAAAATIDGGSVTYQTAGDYAIAFSDSATSKIGNDFGGVLVQTATETPFDAAKSAADWLHAQAVNGAMPGSNAGTSDWGSTLDAIFGLKAAGAPAEQVAELGAALEAHASDYATWDSHGEPGVVVAGAMGKVLVAAAMLGRDVNNFGGMDVRARALATVGAGGTRGEVSDIGKMNNANLFGQSLVMIGLARTGDLPSETVDFLVTQQCAAGYFRIFYTDGETCDAAGGQPDRDATAMAIMALRAAKAKGNASAEAPLTKAVGWLVADQHPNGSFVGSPWTPNENSNSTGLAAAALSGLAPDAVSKATAFVRGLQLAPATAGAAQADLGAVAYDAGAFDGAVATGMPASMRQSWRYATAQAIFALAPVDLYQLSPGTNTAKPDRSLSASSSEVASGETLSVKGRGFRPMETVALTLHSDPVKVAEATADANGEFAVEVRIPAVPAGAHRLVALGADSGVELSVALTVAAGGSTTPSPSSSASPGATTAAGPGASGPAAAVVFPTQPTRSLPTTGGVATATTLIVLGAVAVIATIARRRYAR